MNRVQRSEFLERPVILIAVGLFFLAQAGWLALIDVGAESEKWGSYRGLLIAVCLVLALAGAGSLGLGIRAVPSKHRNQT